ncbi:MULTISPECIES: universal stress protein [unclassified Halorubrum]|uniref:universal stress protein n=1 Tax=unclassified Halorubrum TaxID=2642239 RepID=UPI000B98E8C6|nr:MULTISPECIES: universal stress protein [unclassified Halorubrum]OYR40729.1 universal stress protein UspA [Halorubrum sp. Hd13]OYR47465.1 universal stress protein UspA [Halorubrum sp. Ea8]OYR48070.1 universal stress protein UspA [Halorubrum sp. Eb13]
MTLVVVPVRFPPSSHSAATLREAVRVADERDADLTILHVDLYQNSGGVSRSDLKRAVERRIGAVDRARYVVRRGFLVEETILEEIVAEKADVVVIGSKQAGRWRRMVQKLLSDPDIDSFLRSELDCTVITVEADGEVTSNEGEENEADAPIPDDGGD